uniref:Uncharacterized protein n=1 Tax=Anguilla anguilla TaxID=7936 RepID=A0A0E9UXA5_ANGAN
MCQCVRFEAELHCARLVVLLQLHAVKGFFFCLLFFCSSHPHPTVMPCDNSSMGTGLCHNVTLPAAWCF